MQVAALNSGSNGNCYYISNGTDAILVDAGLSWRQVNSRASILGIDLSAVRGVIISHEHSDHIFGIRGLYKKFAYPFHITTRTIEAIPLELPEGSHFTFTSGAPFQIGSFEIEPIPVSHDAADPHNFVIRSGQHQLGIFTDLGYPNDAVKEHFSNCTAVILETNYDEQMLESGFYPQSLKQRIRGERGHLSNRQALELFLGYRSPKLTHLFLAHLSAQNNAPQLVLDMFESVAGKTQVILTSRHCATELHQIGVPEGFQLSLFGGNG